MSTPTDYNSQFLIKATLAGQQAGHPFPAYAACEAALESAWGRSGLAILGNNLFGRKQSVPPIYDTLDMNTREFINGWITTLAHWVKYPDWASCFKDRLATLQRLAPTYPHYAAALAATDGETFVTEVSMTWSTDPNRGAKVLDIYNAHKDLLSTL